jgi:hypothetical protein
VEENDPKQPRRFARRSSGNLFKPRDGNVQRPKFSLKPASEILSEDQARRVQSERGGFERRKAFEEEKNLHLENRNHRFCHLFLRYLPEYPVPFSGYVLHAGTGRTD